MNMLETLARVAVAMADERPRPPMTPTRRPAGQASARSGGAAGAGFSNPAPKTPEAPQPQPAGGFGEVLGQILAGGTAPGPGAARRGGLGGALDELSELSRPGGAPKGGSFGELLDDRVSGRQPRRAPTADEDGLARVLVRAMLQAAKADGRIDRDERGRILKALGPSPGREEMEFLDAELARPVDVAALAREVPRGAEEQAYLMSLTAVDLDARPEAEYLHQLAQSLRLDARTVNALHARLGAPPLYR